MQGMWVSFKENNCRNTINDVICLPKQLAKHEVRVDDKVVMQTLSSRKAITPPCSLTEVGAEDLARKVIENILGDALTSSTRKTVKIRNVFRVKNSPEVVDTFEKFREMVKKKAKEGEHKHTRSLVDGNELLCFYVTTMTCFSREPKPMTVPCEYSDCKLCRQFESSFGRKQTAGSSMQLSVNSEGLRESIDAHSNKMGSKRVVIICRIIAGRIMNTRDWISEDGHDSIGKKGFYPNSEHLIVNNAKAVLPCFAVLLN